MNKNIRRKTGELLLGFGITPNMKGFRYIVEAVELSIAQPEVNVFKVIAENNNTNKDAVKRDIDLVLKRIDYENEKVKTFFGDVKRTVNVLINVIAWKMENE